jgi:hypothetical protein
MKRTLGTALSLAVLAIFFALTGCVSVRPDADKLGSIGADEVAVVGRARVDPAFGKDEMQMNAIRLGSGWFKDVFLGTGDAPWGDRAYPPVEDTSVFTDSIHTHWNEWYFAKFPKHDFYVQNLIYYTQALAKLQATGVSGSEMEMHSATMDNRRVFLPADRKISVKPEDKVIFIGSWVFARDADNAPKGLKIEDDLDAALPLIKARFGDVKVREAVPNAQ